MNHLRAVNIFLPALTAIKINYAGEAWVYADEKRGG
jgi:hypothetical protein